MKRLLIFIMIVWSNVLLGQQSFFLDSLFKIDVSNIQSVEQMYKLSELNALEKDFGLSIGTNITNSYQEENDNSLSTRIYLRFNALSGGYYDNLMDAEKLFNELKIDSIAGNEQAVNYNYGIYYDYIISEYNKEKLVLIDSILFKTSENQDYFTELYYNKLTDYNTIIKEKNIENRFLIMKESMTTFNYLSEQILDSIPLPEMDLTEQVEIDFLQLVKLLELDSSRHEIYSLEKELIDIKYTKERAANLSVSVGYDISRKQPYYGIACSKNISFGNKRKQNSELLMLSNEFDNKEIQIKKEISVLQMEYQYKQRQIVDQEYKIQDVSETLRELRVRNNILQIEDGITNKNLEMEILLLNYEIVALRQQQTLILLDIKRKIPMFEIGKVVKIIKSNPDIKKFKGKRYVVWNSTNELNAYQKLFLAQNELHLITSDNLYSIQNSFTVYPSDFEDRMEMEKYIISWLNDKGDLDIIIDNLEALKELELKTIKKSRFDITSNTK